MNLVIPNSALCQQLDGFSRTLQELYQALAETIPNFV